MAKQYELQIRSRKFLVVIDRLLIFDVLHQVQERFWGLVGLFGALIGLLICFFIRPDLADTSTAFSFFGEDVRTAPIFVGSIFFAAYGLWRWRHYLVQTFHRPAVISILTTTTILGLYMVAFLPISVGGLVQALHYLGFTIAGVSMTLSVLADTLLRKTRASKHRLFWQLARIAAALAILSGLILTGLSARTIEVLDIALIGESLMFAGYGVWVGLKTYQGEGSQSNISKALAKMVKVEK